MADIFLSYTREDKPRAKLVAEALEQQWSVFWDDKIPGGKPWGDLVDEELNTTKCVVVLWSTKAVKSRWVKTEARRGIEREILVPAILDVCEIPVEFRYHHSANLSAWNGDVTDHEFKKLLEGVRSLTAASIASAITAAAPPVSENLTPGQQEHLSTADAQRRSTLRLLTKRELYARVQARMPTLITVGLVVFFVLMMFRHQIVNTLWPLIRSGPKTVAEQVQPKAPRPQLLEWKDKTLYVDGHSADEDKFRREILKLMFDNMKELPEGFVLGCSEELPNPHQCHFQVISQTGDSKPIAYIRVGSIPGNKVPDGLVRVQLINGEVATFQRYTDGSYRPTSP